MPTNESFTTNECLIAAEEKGKKEKRVPSLSPSSLSSECDLDFLSRSEEAKAAGASVVLSIIQRGYSIPPMKKFRYAVRGYVYPTRRSAKAAAAVDASTAYDTTAPSTLTPKSNDDGDQRL